MCFNPLTYIEGITHLTGLYRNQQLLLACQAGPALYMLAPTGREKCNPFLDSFTRCMASGAVGQARVHGSIEPVPISGGTGRKCFS